MRILNVTAQKPDSTGSGTYLAQLVAAQRALGHEAAVVCGLAPGDEATALPSDVPVFAVRFEREGLPFPVCGMSDAMPYRSTRYRDLTDEMRLQFEAAFRAVLMAAEEGFRPDMVVCHHLYLLTALARETLPGLPLGAVCHSTDLRQMRTHGLERERIIAAVRRLDRVFSLHEEQRREIADLYGIDEARIEVVGAGYDSRVFFPRAAGEGAPDIPGVSDAPAALGAPEVPGVPAPARPARVVFVGKITQKKGVGSLLEALDAVEAPAGLEVDLIGGSGSDEELAALTARAAACRWPVRLQGKRPPEEVAAFNRAADVFVLPSFFEGLPLVVVEALACGCKVVVTDLPGLRPWLERHLPGAPVTYVALPPLVSVDEPDPAALPAFEARLARALEQALFAPAVPCDASGASWERVAERIIEALRPPRS